MPVVTVLTGAARAAGAPEQAQPVGVQLQHRRFSVKLHWRRVRDRHAIWRLLVTPFGLAQRPAAPAVVHAERVA